MAPPRVSSESGQGRSLNLSVTAHPGCLPQQIQHLHSGMTEFILSPVLETAEGNRGLHWAGMCGAPCEWMACLRTGHMEQLLEQAISEWEMSVKCVSLHAISRPGGLKMTGTGNWGRQKKDKGLHPTNLLHIPFPEHLLNGKQCTGLDGVLV